VSCCLYVVIFCYVTRWRDGLVSACPPKKASGWAGHHAACRAVQELWKRSCEGLDDHQCQELKTLLDDNVDLYAANDEDCTRTRLVQHSIDTRSSPPTVYPWLRGRWRRRRSGRWRLQGSSSPWAAPAVLVRKKDDSWRFCVDYRRLNAVTTKDSYPLPRIDDALDYITGSSWFSSLDMRSGYWQVEVAPEARPKTAFTIGQGLWQFRVMPFGLCNAPATFERLMERVLAAVPHDRCVVYLDDLLVHASSFEGAMANLREVFTAIRGGRVAAQPEEVPPAP